MTDVTFASHALALWTNGYRGLVPLVPGAKRPALSVWQRFANAGQTEADLDRLIATYPGPHGIGMTSGNGVTVIDIDVDDHQASNMARSAFERELGRTPLAATGQRPRGKLLYRGGYSTGKASNPAGLAVEIFHGLPGGAGSQVVLFGIHDKTGQPYAWPRDTPLDVPLSELPPVTEDGIRRALTFLHGLAATHPALVAVRHQGGAHGIDATLTQRARSAIAGKTTARDMLAAAAEWMQVTLTPGSRHDGTLALVRVLLVECRIGADDVAAVLLPAWTAIAGEARAAELGRIFNWVTGIRPRASRVRIGGRQL